jgi:hypothetical protein
LGGDANTVYGPGDGTVFKLGPPHGDGTHRTLSVLTNFHPTNVDQFTNSQPVGPVTLYQGALYGTTAYGGGTLPGTCLDISSAGLGCGSIFKVTLGVGAFQWK